MSPPPETVLLRGGLLDLSQGRLLREGGAPVQLSDLERRLLLTLASRPGEAVDRDTLRAEVWRHDPSSLSRAVDTTVQRVRRKIEVDPDRPDHLLTAHGDGYRFVPLSPHLAEPPSQPPAAAPPEAVDARRIHLCGLVVDLTRGQLCGPDGAVVDLSAQELRILQVLDEADGAVVGRHELARRALGSGHAAEGPLTSAVRRLRQRLERDPDAPAHLLTHRGVGYRLVPSPPARPQAPQRGSSFVGRAAELATARVLLGQARLITLVGPPGAGKTRLAEMIVRDPAAPPLLAWCALASVADAEGLRQLLAAALQGSPEDASAPGRLFSTPGRRLLVLDNAEHMHAEVAARALTLVRRLPSLVVLVTSQRRLDLDLERVIEVGPLSTDEAVLVFTHRAWTERGRTPPSHDDDHGLRALVERLDGLPLAIELAAARVDLLGVGGLLTRLDTRLDLLVARPTPDLERRHATLRAALEGSVRLLDDDLRRIFARCAVFRGGFDLEAAEAALGPGALEALERLADRSLLRLLPGGVSPRFELYESVAALARELLEQDPEAATGAKAAHQAHYAALAWRWYQQGRGAELSSGAADLLAELGNLRAAVGMPGPPALRAALTLFLSGALRRRGEQEATLNLLNQALAESETLEEALVARLRVERALTRLTTARTAGSAEDATAALAVGPTHPDVAVLAQTALGLLNLREGRLEPAWELLSEALRTAEGLPADAPRAVELKVAARNHLGIAARRLGRTDEALALYRRALADCAPGPTRGILLLNIAIGQNELGRLDDAWSHAASAITHLEGTPYVAQLSQAHVSLAEVHWRRGELEAADRRLQRGASLARAATSTVDLAFTLLARVGVALEMGRDAEAERRLDEALAATPEDMASARGALALHEAALHALQGRVEAARAGLDRAEACSALSHNAGDRALVGVYRAMIEAGEPPEPLQQGATPARRVAWAVGARLAVNRASR